MRADLVHQPFARGFLTGAIDATTQFAAGDARNAYARFTPEARKANQALVDLLGEIAANKGATKAQLALASAYPRKPWIAPIPGTTKLHRLEENVVGANVALTVDDLAQIDAVLARIKVVGDRYPVAWQALVDK